VTLDCAVIGAGHAGLAASWHLARRGVDHLVVEQGQVANSWRTQRWARRSGIILGADADGAAIAEQVAAYLAGPA
jgi:glycine/D-amino acid oxidase-like deaminating enzyme